jgi:anthranilate phosphoribosyltransferase
MSLAPYVRIVAQGKGRARSLTLDEAEAAMSLILSEDVAPEALGALLMVLRLRGETDEEIAGFTSALRRSVDAKPQPAHLDWPCYAAGRTRGAPLFLLAAKLVANAGYSVSMHGWNSHQNTAADLQQAMQTTGVIGGGLHFTPLYTLSSAAFDLLNLRDTFGLRSCINTVLRMWNPSVAAASVQGVFHPSYRGLQSRAASLLGDKNLTVIKGGGGEFERNPYKDAALFGLRDGMELNASAPTILNDARRLHDPEHMIDLPALWSGEITNPFAEATIIGTAALALWTVGDGQTVTRCEAKAKSLWDSRHSCMRIS